MWSDLKINERDPGRLSQEMLALIQGVVAGHGPGGPGSYLSRGELSRTVLLLFAAVAGLALCGTHAAGTDGPSRGRRNRPEISGTCSSWGPGAGIRP